jgi:hypothetical protein
VKTDSQILILNHAKTAGRLRALIRGELTMPAK